MNFFKFWEILLLTNILSRNQNLRNGFDARAQNEAEVHFRKTSAICNAIYKANETSLRTTNMLKVLKSKGFIQM